MVGRRSPKPLTKVRLLPPLQKSYSSIFGYLGVKLWLMDAERTKERLPYAILESVVSSSAMTLATLYFLGHPDQIGVWLPVFSSFFLILSTLADYKSTQLILNAGGRETNPTLPEHHYDSSKFTSNERLLVESSLVLLGTLLPPFGIGMATARTGVVVSNLLSLRRQLIYNSVHNVPPRGRGMEN